jgi:hypothetical protein
LNDLGDRPPEFDYNRERGKSTVGCISLLQLLSDPRIHCRRIAAPDAGNLKPRQALKQTTLYVTGAQPKVKTSLLF